MPLIKPCLTAVLAVTLCAAGGLRAQTAADAREVVTRAAEALGGAERIQALQRIRLRGYGHDAYQDGGSLITTEPTAPEAAATTSVSPGFGWPIFKSPV